MNYIKINSDGIVIQTVCSKHELKDNSFIKVECDAINAIGKRWNGKTFEEVPIEEVEEPETTEVTNEDLLEVLLAIGEKVGA